MPQNRRNCNKQDSEMMILEYFFFFLNHIFLWEWIDLLASVSLKHAVAHKIIQESEAGSTVQDQLGI